MKDLKLGLLNYAKDYYRNFLFNFKKDMSQYKEICINYILFAKENSNVFKFLFMQEYHIKNR